MPEQDQHEADAGGLDGVVAPLDVVTAWLEASNAGQVERVLELSAPDVELIGPRGSQRGREVLRGWLARAGVRLDTRRVLSDGEQVIVEQHGVWHHPDGRVQGEADVASRFVVHNGRVQLIERHDTFAAALAAAGVAPPSSPT
jgi:hypothetical protein